MRRNSLLALVGYSSMVIVWFAVRAHGTALDAFGAVAALWVLMPYDTRRS